MKKKAGFFSAFFGMIKPFLFFLVIVQVKIMKL